MLQMGFDLDVDASDTAVLMCDLGDLLVLPFVSPADHARIGRLGVILAQRLGVTRETVFQMAVAT